MDMLTQLRWLCLGSLLVVAWAGPTAIPSVLGTCISALGCQDSHPLPSSEDGVRPPALAGGDED